MPASPPIAKQPPTTPPRRAPGASRVEEDGIGLCLLVALVHLRLGDAALERRRAEHDLLAELLLRRRLRPLHRLLEAQLVVALLVGDALRAHAVAPLLFLLLLLREHVLLVHARNAAQQALQLALQVRQHRQRAGVGVRVEAALLVHALHLGAQVGQQLLLRVFAGALLDPPPQRLRLAALAVDLRVQLADVLLERRRLLRHLPLRHLVLLLELLELLFRLLAVLDEEEVALLELREDVEQLLRLLEEHRDVLAAALRLLVLQPRRRRQPQRLGRRQLAHLADRPPLALRLQPLLLLHAPPLLLRRHACRVPLRLLRVQPRPLALRLPPQLRRALLLEVLARREVVEEALVALAVGQRLLALALVGLHDVDGVLELLDLLHLILLQLRLALCVLDGLVRLLVVLLQKGVEADGVLLQHQLALLQRLLLHVRLVLQLADLLALGVERHLHKEHLALLGDEVGHVLLLAPPVVADGRRRRRHQAARVSCARARARVGGREQVGDLPRLAHAARLRRLLPHLHRLEAVPRLPLLPALLFPHFEHLLI
mmetsp:Transcript_19178/g.67688  ORF Transcript_19178/g.67688 Transcript_19178/m.67688 type:complete len:544 (-) Transcript_19178:228-1859(-)